jgi:hypothetical protein
LRNKKEKKKKKITNLFFLKKKWLPGHSKASGECETYQIVPRSLFQNAVKKKLPARASAAAKDGQFDVRFLFISFWLS